MFSETETHTRMQAYFTRTFRQYIITASSDMKPLTIPTRAPMVANLLLRPW